jgi:hypothetical protein
MVSPEANKRLFNLVLPDPFEDYLVHRYGQFAICNLLDGIPKADGFFPLYPKEERQFRVALYGAEPLPDKVLDFLAISHLTQPGALYEWQVRENAFPMVTAGSRPLFTNSASALATVLGPDFDPRETVVLSVEDRAFVNAIADPQATVEIRQVSALRWEVAVKARQPVLVVFAQTFYPAWKATIDGRSTRVLRANHAFQAIEVDVGRHLVTLEYKDRAFQIGLAVSLATAALCLLLWLRRSSPLAEQRREASV